MSAQIGGDNIFEFVFLPNSARTSALAGSLISVIDADVSLAYANPALLNADMHQQLHFSHQLHIGGVQNGYAGMGWHFDSLGITTHLGLQYINYGDFIQSDVFGNQLGTFDASEYAITLGASKKINENYRVGSNIRFVTSRFESYNSTGIFLDLAASYHNPTNNLTLAFVLRNMGTQLQTYSPEVKEPTPFDVQLGISKRLQHLPFRFSVTANNLHRWNVLYDDPNQENATIFLGQDPAEDENKLQQWTDNLFRHILFSGEFLLGKKENLRIRFGYNHLRQREMKLNNLRSRSGFTFGFGLKVSKFRIDYGRAGYHLSQATNHFSISTSLQEFRKNKFVK